MRASRHLRYVPFISRSVIIRPLTARCWALASLSLILLRKLYIWLIHFVNSAFLQGCPTKNSHSLGGGVYLIGDEFRAGFFYFRSNVHRATHCRSLCALPVGGHPLSIRLFNLIVDVSPKTFQESVLKLGPPTWERKGSLHSCLERAPH